MKKFYLIKSLLVLFTLGIGIFSFGFGECDNPPKPDGTCDNAGFVVENNCCVRDCSIASECTIGKIWNSEKCQCVCNPAEACCGVQLNTSVPFIGDCIEFGDTGAGNSDSTTVNQMTAFPILMQGLMKILMSVILILSFLFIIIAGLLMTSGAIKDSTYSKGTDMIKKVIIALILLGCSGLILSLINPNFFGG